MKIINKETISNNNFKKAMTKINSSHVIEWDIETRDVLPNFKEKSQIGKYKHKIFGKNIIVDEFNDAYNYEIIDGKLLFTFMYNMFKEIDNTEVKEYFRTKK